MSNFRSCLKTLALCLAAFACASAQAAQEQKPSIAVLEPVCNSAVSQINKMTAYGALQQYIINSRRYRVVDRSRTDQIMKEHSFAQNGLVDTDKVKEIGKLLSADMVCASEMRKEDGAFIAICSLIDVETGEVTASAYELIEAETPTEIRNGINRAVLTMLGMEVAAPLAKASAPSMPPSEAVLNEAKRARVAIVMQESHKSKRIPYQPAETAISKKLLEAGFTGLAGSNKVEVVLNSDKDRANAILRNDTAAIRAVGAQLGVDFIIAGEASSEAVGPVAGGMFSCRASVETKIFRTNNAQIIATNAFQAGGVDLNEAAASRKALGNAGDLMGDYLVNQLLSVGPGAKAASGIRLTVTGALSFAKVSELGKAIRAIKGVENVRINEYSNRETTLDVATSLSVHALADGFRNISRPVVEVTEASGSEMKVEMR